MFIENLKETISLGRKIAKRLDSKSIILLEGPLGAGKTSLVKGIAEGLSISDEITSPTFGLSYHYLSGKIPLIHMDLYRIGNSEMAQEIFLAEEEEADQREAILIIEWPQLVEPIISNYWKIEISYAKNVGRNYKIWDPKKSLTLL